MLAEILPFNISVVVLWRPNQLWLRHLRILSSGLLWSRILICLLTTISIDYRLSLCSLSWCHCISSPSVSPAWGWGWCQDEPRSHQQEGEADARTSLGLISRRARVMPGRASVSPTLGRGCLACRARSRNFRNN